MAIAIPQLTTRLKFPVAGRSVSRIKQDAKALAGESELTQSQALNVLARKYGVPLDWAKAVNYMEQYDRLAPASYDPVPPDQSGMLFPAPGRITLITGSPLTGTHAVGRSHIEKMLGTPGISALVYQDQLLIPNKTPHIGNEPLWFTGDEISDVLNGKSLEHIDALSIERQMAPGRRRDIVAVANRINESAMQRADEMIIARDRMNGKIHEFNNWRSKIMETHYVHSSSSMPGSKMKWNDGVLYAGTTVYNKKGAEDLLKAATLGSRVVCVSNMVTSLNELINPVTWGLPKTTAGQALMRDILSRVDAVVNLQKIYVSAEGSVVACTSGQTIKKNGTLMSDGKITEHEWLDRLKNSMGSQEADVDRQARAGVISGKLAHRAISALEDKERAKQPVPSFSINVA